MILTSLAMSLALMQGSMDMLFEHGLQVSSSAGTYITYFHADGSYTSNAGIEGTWTVDGSEICVTRSTGESGCAPLQEGAQLGDSWQGVNAATGEMVTYTIVARD